MMLMAFMSTMDVRLPVKGSRTAAHVESEAMLAAASGQPATPQPSLASPGEAMLDADGVIQDCDEVFARQFGYNRNQVLTHHLSELLPELADVELLPHGRLNERLHFFCHIGKRFQALRQDGIQFASRLFLTIIGSDDAPRLRMLVTGQR